MRVAQYAVFVVTAVIAGMLGLGQTSRRAATAARSLDELQEEDSNGYVPRGAPDYLLDSDRGYHLRVRYHLTRGSSVPLRYPDTGIRLRTAAPGTGDGSGNIRT